MTRPENNALDFARIRHITNTEDEDYGQFRIALLEPDKKRSRQICDDVLVPFSSEKNYDFPLYRFYQVTPIHRLNECAPWLHLALISLEAPNALDQARILYAANPDCRICFYGRDDGQLKSLFPVRPIRFVELQDELPREEFLLQLREIFREMECSHVLHTFSNRTDMHIVSQRDILYLKSDVKYVEIHLLTREPISLFKKLRDVEGDLGPAFVRIHKSFIVNAAHVVRLDKRSHDIYLDNGEILPISASCYDGACARFSDL